MVDCELNMTYNKLENEILDTPVDKWQKTLLYRKAHRLASKQLIAAHRAEFLIHLYNARVELGVNDDNE